MVDLDRPERVRGFADRMEINRITEPDTMERGRGDIESVYPLSYMQEGMLFHEINAPGSGINTEQIVCRLHEDLDVTALQRAWRRVVERHTVLRTGFHWVGYSKPVQKVHRHVDVPWEFKDWRGLSDEEQDSRFLEFLNADCRRGFNISRPPLSRWTLFRLRDNDYRLLWSFDHVILDAHAFVLVLIEVFRLYDAFRQGRDIKLQTPTAYEDYVHWLRKCDLTRAESFWREQLKGFTVPTPICPKRCDTRRDGNDLECGEVESSLDSGVTQSLTDLAARNRFSLGTVVQGAWALLLGRYSREEDVVFGSVRACRSSSMDGVESIVGLLINTLPMRVRVAPDVSLIPWLKELRSQDIQFRKFEHSPLVEVHKWSEVPQAAPLFESIIVFDYGDLNSKVQAQGGEWVHRHFRLKEKTKFPITLYAYAGEELKLKIGYQEARCDGGTAGRLLEHLETLLEEIASHPDRRLGEISLLTESDRKQLHEWNDTHAPFPENATVHRLFEDQVERTPDAVALVFENQRVTYRELNTRANRLANHLRGIGVGPEVLVGICIERSVEMAVGLLGILKAGGAYVPLDPTYPTERLAFMVSDARVPVIVLQERFLKFFPGPESNAVVIDRDWDVIAGEPEDNVQGGVKAENLAYVIYTSGSTGKPKGVMVEHRNVVNLFTAMDDRIGYDSGGTWLSVTSPSFDISVLEIFWTLARGFQVVIHSEEKESRGSSGTGSQGADGGCEETESGCRSIPELIERNNVTHLQCTPSLAGMLILDDEVKRAFGRLRKLLIGGETFPPSLATQLREVVTGDIINMYGPTETTVWSTTYKLTSGRESIPIGRPIANTRIHIVDENLQPVPIGIPGEIIIGGAGVARGYLNRPELTAERFIRNHLHSKREGCLYRTGDLARYLPDGNIEFMGRMDHQVKIRGYRIELGEIETVLNDHPDVYKSVVIAREDLPGRKKLVAYVIPCKENNLEPERLLEYTGEKLPGYMVPAHVVTLKAFPQTPNKKIDRRALPPPENNRVKQGAGFDPPHTDIEEAVAGIWTEILGVSRIDRNENFFDLGGDSLSACGIILSIRQTCNVDLPMNILFHEPTVAALAGKLEEAFEKQARAETRFEPPRTPVEKALAPIWAKTLRVDRVGRNDHFFDSGGKSLDAVILFAEIEKEFGRTLPLSTLLQAPTLARLADVLHEEDRDLDWSPLVAIQPAGSKLPFYCVHGHRGNVLNYYPLAHYLGPDQPFYGIQARGLDGEEIGFRSVMDMAVDYLGEILTVQPRGPYVVGGWCAGGLIALEMAQLLKAAGEEVELLVLIDTPHPDYSDFFYRKTIFQRLAYQTIKKIDTELSAFRALGKGEKGSHLWRKTRTLMSHIQAAAEYSMEVLVNKLNVKVPHSRTYKLHRLYDMHERAFKAYDPLPYHGRVVLFRSSKQPYGMYPDPTLGWGDSLKEKLEVRVIPGRYIDLFVEQSARIVADELKGCLEKAGKELHPA